MTYRLLGPDPIESQIDAVLRQIAAGNAPRDIEVAAVDVKEEPGRRGTGGAIQQGSQENEAAARYLAGEMACLANTPGGGALIVGIADDGLRIGTALDPGWLRHRVWELTGGRLTVDVRVVELDNTRLLVLVTHEAIEPIRHAGRIKWRVDDRCIEVDPTTWHTGKLQRSGVDWSAQPSGHTLMDVNPVAIEIARRYLRAAGDEAAQDLAEATDEDLIRRLNVVAGDSTLTNAGSLLFVGSPSIGLDYIRRDVPGGDSTNRVRGGGPLLEQVWDIDQASQAADRVVHVAGGFAHGQLRALSPRAVREAIVNGSVHRDWASPQPTTIEHIGDTLIVTSPGGFIGGVDPSNIITHPAVPRYRSLAEAMAALRLAEREGIGIDRMVRDMLSVGHQGPEITEVAGPYVRVALIGGDPDQEILALMAAAQPPEVSSDVDALLVIEHLSQHGWIDVDRAAPVLQRPPAETAAALARIAEMRVNGDPLITPLNGVPAGHPPAYRLSDPAQAILATRTTASRVPDHRREMVLAWARARGRVSSTEVSDLTGLSVPSSGALLTALEGDGRLAPGRGTKLGRGFFYIPVGPAQ
ncbi:MAG: ATP-binding protein [Microthrixaceae bacterium]